MIEKILIQKHINYLEQNPTSFGARLIVESAKQRLNKVMIQKQALSEQVKTLVYQLKQLVEPDNKELAISIVDALKLKGWSEDAIKKIMTTDCSNASQVVREVWEYKNELNQKEHAVGISKSDDTGTEENSIANV